MVSFINKLTETVMGYCWVDSLELALDLMEAHPDVDPLKLHFTELREWVLALENFDDDPKHCGERVLEAIQLAWISEMD
jgi:FeS assembly protein IscX